MNCGIYKITNLVNNKIYIGCSANIYERFQKHISDLKKNTHHNKYLQRSWNKYGKDNFKFEVFYICAPQDLESSEIYFIDKLKSHKKLNGYNLTLGGSVTKCGIGHPNYGKKWSEKRKLEASISRKGRKVSPETKLKMSIARKGKINVGIKHSKQHCIKNGIVHSRPVLQYDLNNNFIKKWNSATEAYKILNISNKTICHCCKGRLNSSGGYIWKYTEDSTE